MVNTCRSYAPLRPERSRPVESFGAHRFVSAVAYIQADRACDSIAEESDW